MKIIYPSHFGCAFLCCNIKLFGRLKIDNTVVVVVVFVGGGSALTDDRILCFIIVFKIYITKIHINITTFVL